jgi:AIPR protein
MSIVHIRHITKLFDRVFGSIVDMADYKGKSQAQVDDAFHTRAQAAFSLTFLAKVDPQIAATSITDSFDDNGIDAIRYEQDDRILFLVQSKWHKNGQGSIESAEVMKFVHGVRGLLEANFSRFNSKVVDQQDAILATLDDPNLRVHLVLVHTGVQPLSTHARRPLDDFLKEINDVSNIATATTVTQKDLHKAISSDSEGRSIKLEVMLHEWGQCKQPYSAYYGQVEAADIGRWWEEHQQLLFAKNLRKFTGSTDVNEAIKGTLANEPSKFWYFNNGITILCNSLQKKALGGSKRTSGVFVCEGVSVVNGAQTVGCIGEVAVSAPDALLNARVGVRLISLANCPEEFGTDISRAANTQNRIERRDFAALDPEQERLRRELLLELGKSYFYKSGDTPGAQSEGCTIEEATVALACANQDASLAVQAKREIGKLWEDIARAPYKLLFNGSVTALRMWRLVEILRRVDATLKEEQDARVGRERMVAVHGNRLILQQVFRVIGVDAFDDPQLDFEGISSKARSATPRVLDLLFKHVETEFPGAYPNSLFKNATKCKTLSEKMASSLPATRDQAKAPFIGKGKGRKLKA